MSSLSWRKVCVCFQGSTLQLTDKKRQKSAKLSVKKKNLSCFFCQTLLSCPLQTSTPSGSSRGRTVSTTSTSSSTALTSLEVLSRSESGNQDRPESLAWCRRTELDWREAQQVGHLSVSSPVSIPLYCCLFKQNKLSI